MIERSASKESDSMAASQTNKSLFSLSNAIKHYGNCLSEGESSMANKSEPPLKRRGTGEEVKYLKKQQLEFSVIGADCWVANSSSIQVKIMIKNDNDWYWPEGIRIRGKGSELIRHHEFPLKKRLRMRSICGITFVIPVKSQLLSTCKDTTLKFEFCGVDESKTFKYYSKVIEIPFDPKKTSCKQAVFKQL